MTMPSPAGNVISATHPDLTCTPRFFTPRNLDRPTLGPKVAEVARMLGTPLMPWQQYVADVAMEIDPATNLLYYREIDLGVPRQSGKTTEILAVAVHRARAWARAQNIAYAAQTRNDSRKKWEDDHVAALDASPIGRRKPKPYRVRLTNGNEAIMWDNGSKHGIVATTEKSGHGSTLDLGFIDEAFSQQDGRLEQAFKPAMITRPDPQLWVVSTAGRSAASSPYLWGKVEAGRERCADGHHPGIAYFEWSAPDELDRADPATWWATMPALGHTITEAAVAADFASMDPAEFDRAYLNRWNPNAVDAVIPGEAFAALGTSPGIDGPVTLAYDVTPDQSWACISASGAADGLDGITAGEIIEHRESTGWVLDRLVAIRSRNDCPGPVFVDGSNPAACSLLPQLDAAGIPFQTVSSTDYMRGCSALLDDVLEARMVHAPDPGLDVAVASASRRISGDGWKWSRRSSSVDISPLVALTLSLHGHRSEPAIDWASQVI